MRAGTKLTLIGPITVIMILIIVLIYMNFFKDNNENQVCSYMQNEPESKFQQVITKDGKFEIIFNGYLHFHHEQLPNRSYMEPKLKEASRSELDEPGWYLLDIEFDCCALKLYLYEPGQTLRMTADFIHPTYGNSSCYVIDQLDYKDFKIAPINYWCSLNTRKKNIEINIRRLSFGFSH